MEKLNFLAQIDKNFFNKINKKKEVYRGEIPWILERSDFKKIIYISASNKNLENYYSMLDNYFFNKNIFSKNFEKNKKYIDIFENISQTKEDIVGINVKMLDILKNQNKFILFMNLQIALDIFFEKVNFFKFKIGSEYKFSEIKNFFLKNGYESSYLVEKKGQFSQRGDIVDIFPPDLENPVRFEFFGDELESIRFFEVDSQISIEKIEEIKIFGNILSGNKFELVEMISEINNDDVLIVTENEELVDYKLEEYILLNRDKENLYRKRYENLKKKSFFVLAKNFSKEQLETFKNKEKLEKLANKNKIFIQTKNYEKKLSDYNQILKKNQNNFFVSNFELFEGFLSEKNKIFVLTDRELDGYIYEI